MLVELLAPSRFRDDAVKYKLGQPSFFYVIKFLTLRFGARLADVTIKREPRSMRFPMVSASYQPLKILRTR